MKIAVVYWSGTGNTETMANAVADGASGAGANATVIEVANFSAADVDAYDAIAFGCPAMGAEELEADEFEPVWNDCIDVLGNKPIALFGSYDWGTGEWMETWQSSAEDAGLNVVGTTIANNDPDAAEIAACEDLGKSLA